MTREEVKYASKDYVNYLLDKQEYHNEKYTEDDIRQAFEKGAVWADEHPKNIWHDASEKPKENMDILFTSRNRKAHIVYKGDHSLYNWLNDTNGVKKWAYLYDLLPKEN